MIQGFEGYNETQVNEYGNSTEKIKLGGHICKIIEAEVKEYTNKDGGTFSSLVIKFDFDESDEQAGYYAKKFAADSKADALNAKWKGFHRISIPTNNSQDFIKTMFKTFTTSVEKSNPGYKWAWDETTLAGKLFGGVYRIEEFTLTQGVNAGNTIETRRLAFVRSTEKVTEVDIPKVKLVDGTTVDYDVYQAGKVNAQAANNVASTFADAGLNVEFTDAGDDLPF